jgi:hypothetical protein
MMLKIKTTGLEQYMPGGEANMKVMVIGGPGVGKTRWSSYWPMPIYANCEAGLASVADRRMPYVDIGGSDDMLEFLRWLKRHPDARKFGTVVIDTLDSFQRKVKDEWLLANPSAEAFSGYDAWGYLDAKMQALMTRLLSLDKNVLVLVHYKDKTVTEKVGSNTVERHVLSLQLQGDIKDTAFNDFDLVGWMDTYFEAQTIDGAVERVQRRGLTFKPSPAKPFLKDRLHITPEWLPVEFAESDYVNLFSLFTERMDELEESQEVGTVVAVDDPEDRVIDESGVRKPTPGGPVAPQDPREMPLDKLTKPELLELAEKEDLKLKTGMLKAQIVAAIKAHREDKAKADAEPADAQPASPPEDTSEPPPADETPSTDVDEQPVDDDADETPQEDTKSPEEVVAEGEQAVKEELGGTLVSETPAAEAPKTEPKAAPATSGEPTCEECGKALAGESGDLVKLAFIKFRKRLCNEDYRKAKAAAR